MNTQRSVIYARLSLTRNGENVSIERQLEQGHRYIASRRGLAHNCATDHFVEPEGHRSGTNTKRPAYSALMDLVESRQVTLVWVVKQDRLTRADDFMQVLKTFNKCGVELVIDQSPVDLNTFDGELNARFTGLFSTMYAMRVSHDQKRRIREEKANGVPVGGAPQGLKFAGHGMNRHYVPREDKFTMPDGSEKTYLQTVEKFMELYATGNIGLPTICKRLNECGWKWRNKVTGEPEPLYIHKADDLRFENYVTFFPALVARCIQVRTARSGRKQNRQQPSSHFIPPKAYGITYCVTCGRRLRSHRTNQNKLKGYYRHHPAPCPDGNYAILACKIDDQVLALPPIQRIMNLTEDERRDVAERAVRRDSPDPAKERARLKAQLDRLESDGLDMVIAGTLSRNLYDTKHAELMARLAASPVMPPTQMTVQSVIHALEDMQTIINNGDPFRVNDLMRVIFERINVRRGVVLDYVLKSDVMEWLKS